MDALDQPAVVLESRNDAGLLGDANQIAVVRPCAPCRHTSLVVPKPASSSDRFVIGYSRRVYGNFTVVDNRAVSAADYTPFSVIVPNDSRLPESGNVVGGYYDVVPSKFGLQDNLTTLARK